MEKKKNGRIKTAYFVVLILAPIILGTILYYLFCPEVWFVEKIDAFFNIHQRNKLDITSSLMLRLLRYYAFDFLWAFSLSGCIYIIFNNSAKVRCFCLIIPVIIGALLEVLQLLDIALGTFDIFDIVVEGMGAMLCALIIKNIKRRVK